MNTTNDNTAKKASGHAAEGVVQENITAVNSAQSRQLYNKRQQIYPKEVHGKYRKIKWILMSVLLGIYFILPFLRWHRTGSGSDQFVLADFANRRFYFGPIEIWPQEVYYITGLLILGALGLFLATSLFGRVWCGYSCPQTVWTDLFLMVERFFEGDRNQRIRLDKAPWSFNKAWRKIGKHIVWLIISFLTGGWFVMYFDDAYKTLHGFLTGTAPISSYILAGSLTFTTYLLAGTMREQVCTYMCPWPRIQAAMLDSEALSVTYKYDRGEPRGPHRKNETWEGRGDCVDCRQCVAVCPAGIDIRDGLQLECINCALCIDSCNEIMAKVGRPSGLIGYDTIGNIERREKGLPNRFDFVRPRTVFYGVLFLIVSGIITFGLLNRHTMEVNVIRDRAPLFVTLSDGQIRNAYTLKLLNMAGNDRNVEIYFDGIDTAKMETEVGKVDNNKLTIETKPNKVSVVRMFMVADPNTIKDKTTKIKINVKDVKTGEIASSKSVFITAQ